MQGLRPSGVRNRNSGAFSCLKFKYKSSHWRGCSGASILFSMTSVKSSPHTTRSASRPFRHCENVTLLTAKGTGTGLTAQCSTRHLTSAQPSPWRQVGFRSHWSIRECVFSSRARPMISRKSDGPVTHRPSAMRPSCRRRISDMTRRQSARSTLVRRTEISLHARSIARMCASQERTRSTAVT